MIRLILLLLTATVAHSLLSEPPNLPDDWKAPHYKVFGNNVPAISPEETYDTLVQLVKIYQGRVDELSNTRRLRAEALVNEKKLNPDRCCQASFDNLSRLLTFHSVNTINVIPYLKRVRLERLKFCQKKFALDIMITAEQLDPHDKSDVIEMVEAIHDSHNEYSNHMEMFTPRHNLVDGIIEYMNHHLGYLNQNEEVTGKYGRRHLGQLFIKHVSSLCRRVDELILPKTKIYRRLMFDDELMREVDEQTKDWIMRAFVCKDIIRNSISLVDEMHSIIIKSVKQTKKEKQKRKKKKDFGTVIKSLIKPSNH